MKVILSGLTAAGKTTHGKILASELGVPFFSATNVLASILAGGRDHKLEARWSPSMDSARQEDCTLDEKLDSEMLRLFTTSASGVFDASMLPWVVQEENVIKVWLDSGLSSRIRKCFVSHLDENINWHTARHRVLFKDKVSVSRMVVAKGAALYPDPDVFNLIISNGDLIPEPTRECAERGISIFSVRLSNALESLTRSAPLSDELTSVIWTRSMGQTRADQTA